MEMPAAVLIHNDQLGMKGKEGTLLAIQPDGYYVVSASFGSSDHRMYLPIASTVLIAADPEEEWTEGVEIEP